MVAQIFSGTIARMINAFLSAKNDTEAFTRLLHRDGNFENTNEEIVGDISDEENMVDQFFTNVHEYER